jgi:hypothetical protein
MKSRNIRRAAQTNRVTPGTARPAARRRTASQPRHYWPGDVLAGNNYWTGDINEVY